jgi:hypothetical protein
MHAFVLSSLLDEQLLPDVRGASRPAFTGNDGGKEVRPLADRPRAAGTTLEYDLLRAPPVEKQRRIPSRRLTCATQAYATEGV